MSDDSDESIALHSSEPLWRVEEIASHFGCDMDTARGFTMRSDFPWPLKLTGRQWRWFPNEVRGWTPGPARERPGGCQLYKHYDKNGRLLYVGISLSHLYRLAKHKQQSAWFNDVVTIKIRHYPTREAAKRAESAAIAKYRPRNNRTCR